MCVCVCVTDHAMIGGFKFGKFLHTCLFAKLRTTLNFPVVLLVTPVYIISLVYCKLDLSMTVCVLLDVLGSLSKLYGEP